MRELIYTRPRDDKLELVIATGKHTCNAYALSDEQVLDLAMDFLGHIRKRGMLKLLMMAKDAA